MLHWTHFEDLGPFSRMIVAFLFPGPRKDDVVPKMFDNLVGGPLLPVFGEVLV
jgi:hypothetical protein